MISAAWPKCFDWDGTGPMPAAERDRLRRFATMAHAQGRLLRFWGAPDRPLVWAELAAAGVTLINTERLRDFAAWSREPGTMRAP